MEPLLTEQLISVLFAFSMGQDIVDMESLVFSVVWGFGFFLATDDFVYSHLMPCFTSGARPCFP